MWGTFDTLDSPIMKHPQLVQELAGKNVVAAVCGSSQVVISSISDFPPHCCM